MNEQNPNQNNNSLRLYKKKKLQTERNLAKSIKDMNKTVDTYVNVSSTKTKQQVQFFASVEGFEAIYKLFPVPANKHPNFFSQLMTIVTVFSLSTTASQVRREEDIINRDTLIVGLDTKINALMRKVGSVIIDVIMNYTSQNYDKIVGVFKQICTIISTKIQTMKNLQNEKPKVLFYQNYFEAFKTVAEVLQYMKPRMTRQVFAKITVTDIDMKNKRAQSENKIIQNLDPSQKENQNQIIQQPRTENKQKMTQPSILKTQIQDQIHLKKLTQAGKKIQAANSIVQINLAQLGNDKKSEKALVISNNLPKILNQVIKSVQPEIKIVQSIHKEISSITNASPRRSFLNTISKCYLSQVINLNNSITLITNEILSLVPLAAQNFKPVIMLKNAVFNKSLVRIHKRLIFRTLLSVSSFTNYSQQQLIQIQQQRREAVNVLSRLDIQSQKTFVYLAQQYDIQINQIPDFVSHYAQQILKGIKQIKQIVRSFKKQLQITKGIYKQTTQQTELEKKRIMDVLNELKIYNENVLKKIESSDQKTAKQLNQFIMEFMLQFAKPNKANLIDYVKNHTLISSKNKQRLNSYILELELLTPKSVQIVQKYDQTVINQQLTIHASYLQNKYPQIWKNYYQNEDGLKILQDLNDIYQSQQLNHQQIMERFDDLDQNVTQVKSILTKFITMYQQTAHLATLSSKPDQQAIALSKIQCLSGMKIEQLMDFVKDQKHISDKISKILHFVENHSKNGCISQDILYQYFTKIIQSGVTIKEQISQGQKELMCLLQVKNSSSDINKQIAEKILSNSIQINKNLVQINNRKDKSDEGLKKYIQFRTDSITAYLTALLQSNNFPQVRQNIEALITTTSGLQETSKNIYETVHNSSKVLNLVNQKVDNIGGLINELILRYKNSTDDTHRNMNYLMTQYRNYCSSLNSSFQNLQYTFHKSDSQRNNSIMQGLSLMSQMAMNNQQTNIESTEQLKRKLDMHLEKNQNTIIKLTKDLGQKQIQIKCQIDKRNQMIRNKQSMLSEFLNAVDTNFGTNFDKDRNISRLKQFLQLNRQKVAKYVAQSQNLSRIKSKLMQSGQYSSTNDPFDLASKLVYRLEHFKTENRRLAQSSHNRRDDQTLQNLKQTNRQLKSQTKELQKQIKQKDKQIQKLQASLSRGNRKQVYDHQYNVYKDESPSPKKVDLMVSKAKLQAQKTIQALKQAQTRKVFDLQVKLIEVRTSLADTMKHSRQNDSNLKEQIKQNEKLKSQIEQLKRKSQANNVNQQQTLEKLKKLELEKAKWQAKQQSMKNYKQLLSKHQDDAKIEMNKKLRQIQQLKAKNQRQLKQKLLSLQKREQQFNKIEKKLLTKENEIQTLTKDLNQKSKQYQKAKRQYQSSQDVIKGLHIRVQQVTTIQNEIQLLKKQRVQLKRTINQLDIKEDSYLSKIKDFQAKKHEYAAAKKQIENLQQQITDIESKSKKKQRTMRQELNELKDDIQKKQQELVSSKSKYEGLLLEKKKLQSKVQQLNQQPNKKSAIQKKVSDLQVQLKIENDLQATKDKQINTLKFKIESLKTQYIRKQNELNQQKDALNIKFQTTQKQLNKVKTQVDSLKKQIDGYKEIEQKMMNKIKEIKQLKLKQQQLVDKMNKYQLQKTKLSSQISVLQQNLAIKKTERNELEIKLNEHKIQSQRERSLLKSQLQKIQNQKRQKENQLKVVQLMVQQNQKKIKKAEAQRDEEVSKNQILNKAIKQVENRNDNLVIQIQKIKKDKYKMTELQEKLKKYSLTTQQVNQMKSQYQDLNERFKAIKVKVGYDKKLRQQMADILKLVEKEIIQQQQKYNQICEEGIKSGNMQKASVQCSLYLLSIQKLKTFIKQLMVTSNNQKPEDETKDFSYSRRNKPIFDYSKIQNRFVQSQSQTQLRLGNLIGKKNNISHISDTTSVRSAKGLESTNVIKLSKTIEILESVIVQIFEVTIKTLQTLLSQINKFKSTKFTTRSMIKLNPKIIAGLQSLASFCQQILEIILHGTQKELNNIDYRKFENIHNKIKQFM